jgi:hypothetical protein
MKTLGRVSLETKLGQDTDGTVSDGTGCRIDVNTVVPCYSNGSKLETCEILVGRACSFNP